MEERAVEADVRRLKREARELNSASEVPRAVRTTLAIAKMDCPTEEALIRGRLSDVAGISALDFNLMQRTVTIHHAPGALAPAVAAIRSLGMEVVLQDEVMGASDAPPRNKHPSWPLALSGTAAIAAEAAHWLGAGGDLTEAILATVAILAGGLPTYKKGWIALRNRNLNINALMSIAVTGAFLIGQWPEGAMVMFLFALAEVIEAKSMDRARDAIHGLMALAPARATVRQDDGLWLEVEAATVAIGALVRVRPGESIALDGAVVSGRSAINQAPITGESLPVEKAEGDAVFAGTINETGSFEYRVTAAATNSTLARIIHAVEEAQGTRAPTQRFVERFARIYTPAVFVVALSMLIVPPLALGLPWLDAVYRALVLLVVACPCALVISTPVTIVSGLATAARHGVLVKGGVYLEQGHLLKVLAVDKTGTLTHGHPEVTDFELLGSDDEGRIRGIAASLSSRSDHPVSRAITRACQSAGVASLEVEDFVAYPGRGVRGRIEGRAYELGNHRRIEELKLCSPDIEKRLDALEREGKSVVLLVDDLHVLALFAVADTVRDTSREAIATLHEQGVKVVMLSGDNPHTAAAIGAQLGIDETLGNQLPEDKLAAMVSLRPPTGIIGMVGDGINDAPALARADIGFAMGAAGTDTALETADVALMDDDLRKIPWFIELSHQTGTVLRQNIALAVGIKIAFIGLVFTGQATMWMAVFADMGASLLVVANGLRLLRKREGLGAWHGRSPRRSGP